MPLGKTKCMVAIPVLAACVATTDGYAERVQSFVGLNDATLIQQWGVPHAVYETGGVKYLSYRAQRKVVIPGIAPTYKTKTVGNTTRVVPVGGIPDRELFKSCETTFQVKRSKIINASFKGNDCRAVPADAS